MFGSVWMDPRLYAYEALMADDTAWSAAKLAHGVCDKRRKRTLAPRTREEEEERRQCARRMAEALFVAGMRSAAGAVAQPAAPAEMPDARSPTPHWDAETNTFSFPN